MTAQINPPFDGSAPCPMCSQEIRGIGALVHNFLVRWPEPKALTKLHDLSKFYELENVHSDNALVEAELRAAEKVVIEFRKFQALLKSRGADYGTFEDIKDLSALVPELLAASAAAQVLSEAHFHDARHASGQTNILRERRGSGTTLDGKSYSLDRPVTIVPYQGDVFHKVCGTGLEICEEYKADIRKDPTFFGEVWCPTCAMNLPIAQFEIFVV